MKKTLLFTLSLLGCFFLTFAQQPEIGKVQQLDLNFHQDAAHKTTAIDTIFDYLNRASSAVLYGSQDGGYVVGTAFYDNMGTIIPVSDATGMLYSGIPNARVTEILTWFGDVIQSAAADTVFARVYSIKPDSTPLAVLGSGAVTSDMLNPATSFILSSIPITFGGNGDTGGNDFMITVEYAGIDDTLGIVASNGDSADGNGERRLRQLSSAAFGASWMSIENLWGPFDLDAFIFPVIDDAPVAVDQFVGAKGLHLLGNFPNPATSASEIRYSLTQREKVHLRVFDLAGREIYNSGWIMTEPGEHSIQVDVSDKPAGAYYYTIKTQGAAMTSKLQVLK